MPTTPLPPLPDPRRDWLPAVIRFVIGALFGAPCGIVLAARHTTSDTLQIAGLVAGAVLGGGLAAWLRGRFWESVARGHWSGWL
jgi:hypothetical protein